MPVLLFFCSIYAYFMSRVRKHINSCIIIHTEICSYIYVYTDIDVCSHLSVYVHVYMYVIPSPVY